jgi:T-complex protein 1 subunit gamma
MQAPVVVLNNKTQRDHGRKAQLSNIEAAKTVASLINSCIGPNAMLKLLISPMGGAMLTNDGNAILREIDVVHPAARHMLELARAQDEEVGDGTTSVIILTAEMLTLAQPVLERQVHPLKIVKGFTLALNDALEFIDKVAVNIDTENREQMLGVIRTCLGTKMTQSHDMLMCDLALAAVKRVYRVDSNTGRKEIDVKRYAKIEKIPGGSIEESVVLDGVMFNKDHVHQKMRRRIEKPRILLLDTALEYTKAATNINVEVSKDADWDELLKQEEDFLRRQAKAIIALKPDVVITEKGVSDISAHFLMKANITVIRRLRKTDNNRIARAAGATICSRVEEATEADIGKGAGLFEIKKIGDEYFTFITQCPQGSACSVLLRGASKDTLNEMERNLHDAMSVARNILLDPKTLYGGGAIEMYLSRRLSDKAKSVAGVHQSAYQAVALALECIPRALASNCGANVVRLITDLRARHHTPEGFFWGVDGIKGVIADIRETKVIEPAAVKIQALKTAIEAACMILRVDDVVSGTKTDDTMREERKRAAQKPQEEDPADGPSE